MRKIFYCLLVAGLLLAACSEDSEDSSVQAEKEEHEEKVTDRGQKTEVQVNGENQYPLTGEYTNEPVDNRIIGVMVNNHTQARPQSGLSQADIVFEALAEGDITRFLALFQSDIPDMIGPVRSAREYYFDLANRYDALYVYHGAADFINRMIVNEGIPYLDGAIYDNDGQLFRRETFRQAPHNSYLLTDAVYDMAETKGYDTAMDHEPLMFLEEDQIAAIEGDAAEHVEIVYSENPMEIVEYEFDAATGKYKRYNDGEETVELNSGEPIEVENIFIVETYHEVVDDAGRRYIDLDSGGNAYLIQNGKAQHIEWENDDGRLVPIKDGEQLGFVPGKTWVNIVPTSPSMEQSVTISGE